jgi:hypothetical protein
MNALVTGPACRFADWPNDQVPRRAAGVYTIWRQEEFIYVGMSGRGARAEDFVASQGQAKGLWTRLGSHASGRRSGDQFNVYICDRFVVPALTPSQQRDIGEGKILLDRMTNGLHTSSPQLPLRGLSKRHGSSRRRARPARWAIIS